MKRIMMDFLVKHYCPVCDKVHTKSIGHTVCYQYKGQMLTQLYCNECKTQLLCETSKVENFGIDARDHKALAVSGMIFGLIEESGYDENTPEETMETELLEKLRYRFGDKYIDTYEYEAKVLIQKVMAYSFHIPKLTAYVMDDEVKQNAVHVSTTMW